MSNFLTSFYPGDAIALALAGVLAQISVVISLAVVTSRALARLGAAARHAVWLSALGCVLASPLLTFLAGRAGLVLVALPLSPRENTVAPATDGPWVESMTVPSLTPGAAPSPGPVREHKAGESAARAKHSVKVVAKPSVATNIGNGGGEQSTEPVQPASQR